MPGFSTGGATQQPKKKLGEKLPKEVKPPGTFRTEDTFGCCSSPPEFYRCKLSKCTYNSHLKLTLTHHVRAYHEKNYNNPSLQRRLESYQCNTCDFKTYSELVLLKHVYSKCDGNPGSSDEKLFSYFKCEQCCYRNKSKQGLNNHIIAKHPLSKEERMARYKCTLCAYLGDNTRALKRHILTKHPNSEQVDWFKCEHCSHKTKYKNNMKYHLIRHLSSQDKELMKKFKCAQCSYQTISKAALRRHIRVNHMKVELIKWFECEHCSYKTRENCNLKIHALLKHTNPEDIKWFQCEQCSFKTKTNRSLKLHCKVKHGIK